MHGCARVPLPDIAAGPQAIGGDGPVAHHMQPARFARHPQAGLVHAGHRDGQGLSLLAGRLRRQPCDRTPTEGLDRARRQGHPVPFPQQGPQSRHRQVLRIAQVGRPGLQARPTLHRPGHVRGKGRPRPGAAVGAAHHMGPVFRHGQGRRVVPVWPGWPPAWRPRDRRRLRGRGGAAGPSCEGGWPLLPLCRWS